MCLTGVISKAGRMRCLQEVSHGGIRPGCSGARRRSSVSAAGGAIDSGRSFGSSRPRLAAGVRGPRGGGPWRCLRRDRQSQRDRRQRWTGACWLRAAGEHDESHCREDRRRQSHVRFLAFMGVPAGMRDRHASVPGQASGGRARPSRTRASPVSKAAPASRSGALTNISIVGSRPVANCRLR